MKKLINGCLTCIHRAGMICTLTSPPTLMINLSDTPAREHLPPEAIFLRVRPDDGILTPCPLRKIDDLYVLGTIDEVTLDEVLNTTDPTHHTWTIRSRATGRRCVLHFYPIADGVYDCGYINGNDLNKQEG